MDEAGIGFAIQKGTGTESRVWTTGWSMNNYITYLLLYTYIVLVINPYSLINT